MSWSIATHQQPQPLGAYVRQDDPIVAGAIVSIGLSLLSKAIGVVRSKDLQRAEKIGKIR